MIDGLCSHYRDAQVDVVLGIEARGFIFAPALAYALGAGFVPVRKPKKLPAECVRVSYDLEYGTDSLEMHRDAVGAGSRVLIVDDLLATGGTAAASPAGREAGGKVAGLGFAIELTFLNGRAKLDGLRGLLAAAVRQMNPTRQVPPARARQDQPGSARAACAPGRVSRAAHHFSDHLPGRHHRHRLHAGRAARR